MTGNGAVENGIPAAPNAVWAGIAAVPKALWNSVARIGRWTGSHLWIRWQLILVLVIYGAAVVWTATAIKTTRAGAYVATRVLDANHWIVPSDIAAPSSGPQEWGWFLPDQSMIVGKYIKTAIESQKPITIENLRTEPDLTGAEKNHHCFLVPLDAQQRLLADVLNANSYVDIVGDAEVVAPQVRVMAVGCKPGADAKSPPACYVALAVPNDKEKDILAKKTSLRLAPVPAKS